MRRNAALFLYLPMQSKYMKLQFKDNKRLKSRFSGTSDDRLNENY